MHCDGRLIAYMQCKPHKSVKVLRSYSSTDCFVQKTLENVLFNYFPEASVVVVEESEV